MKNVSVPTLVVAEIPTAILVSERTDHPAQNYDTYYLASMMRGFVPYFIEAISTKSDDYLPGDAENLSKEIFNYMKPKEHDENLIEFFEQYRKRYFGNQVVQRATVLHSCLINILKMPFNLTSSIEQGLMIC
ncbi:hypothetical protein N7495_003157 [Penicillium taxi]|uniref:uncharacterized protein n=1 Tax=Penicillium taxi TaxID=168475 RepID=UPI0025455A96|nr:uncharacterized protein N7495_003157 [Penicillium taxi]KAJ5902629.1 hypothetical protein N7495_003157 [Penicillium taxi]